MDDALKRTQPDARGHSERDLVDHLAGVPRNDGRAGSAIESLLDVNPCLMRPPHAIDRQAFREEVVDRAERIARTLEVSAQPADLAARPAADQSSRTWVICDRKSAIDAK